MAPSSADEPQEAAKVTAQHEPEPADRTLSGLKRKEMEPRKRPSFKAIGHLVMAMRRFTGGKAPQRAGKRSQHPPRIRHPQLAAPAPRRLSQPYVHLWQAHHQQQRWRQQAGELRRW